MLKNGFLQKETYYEDDIACIFAGIKKDEEGKLNYQDKFLNSKVFQWEIIVDVSESIKKMESEETVTLPYTYFD